MVPDKSALVKKKSAKTAPVKSAQAKSKKEKKEPDAAAVSATTLSSEEQIGENTPSVILDGDKQVPEVPVAVAAAAATPVIAAGQVTVAPSAPTTTTLAKPLEVRPAISSQSQNRPVAPFKIGDDYTLLVHYDKGTRIFTGEVAEIAEVTCTGMSREEVLKQLTMRLEDFIEDHRIQGGLPEAIFSRRYPEKLNVAISQSVYRKLDMLSRQEKVGMDHLVAELLSAAVDRRLDGGKGGQKLVQPTSNQGRDQRGESPRHGGQNRHGGHDRHDRHGGGQNRGGGRHNQGTGNLDNRENFMEYVRNLEKGGSRWKK